MKSRVNLVGETVKSTDVDLTPKELSVWQRSKVLTKLYLSVMGLSPETFGNLK